MHAHGQARESVNSAIDWIEQIPFDETRNYVQRILESLQIYRMQVDGSESGVTIENDLRR
jgi:soluble lytic murein transglycosylase